MHLEGVILPEKRPVGFHQKDWPLEIQPNEQVLHDDGLWRVDEVRPGGRVRLERIRLFPKVAAFVPLEHEAITHRSNVTRLYKA